MIIFLLMTVFTGCGSNEPETIYVDGEHEYEYTPKNFLISILTSYQYPKVVLMGNEQRTYPSIQWYNYIVKGEKKCKEKESGCAKALRQDFPDYSSIQTKKKKALLSDVYGYIVENYEDGKMVKMYPAAAASHIDLSKEGELANIIQAQFFVRNNKGGNYAILRHNFVKDCWEEVQ